jgi:tRNA(Ile)-lysidine synthase
MTQPPALPLTPAESEALFHGFSKASGVLIGVSGGADSTALLVLAAEWMRAPGRPRLIAATVDHGLRTDGAAEAAAVGEVCARLGVHHLILRWTGEKPTAGIEAAAREARYRLLESCAHGLGLSHLATAHTRDDQAETVLLRLAAGSGPAGLAAMRPHRRRGSLVHIRPFLDVPKSRLVATLQARGERWSEDGMNRDLRFARPRLRATQQVLSAEGLTHDRLARLAHRMARTEDAVRHAADGAWARIAEDTPGQVRLDGAALAGEPDEIALRLLMRAVHLRGGASVSLLRAERLLEAVKASLHEGRRSARTLGGAKISTAPGEVLVTTAPPRRTVGASPGGTAAS